jgi:hypothetical protein
MGRFSGLVSVISCGNRNPLIGYGRANAPEVSLELRTICEAQRGGGKFRRDLRAAMLVGESK